MRVIGDVSSIIRRAEPDQCTGARRRCRRACTAVIGSLLFSTSLLSELSAGWFTTAEEHARRHFADGAYEAAAAEFQDSYRRGVALYRAGRYQDAAEAFAAVKRAEVRLDAQYNLGNARFQLGQYQRAIQAYEAVLARDPDHADAKHNLALANRLLRREHASVNPSEHSKRASPEQRRRGAESQPSTENERAAAEVSQQDKDSQQESSEARVNESSSAEQPSEQQNDGGSKQEQNQSENSETSKDEAGKSGESEGESAGEAQDQQSGQSGQQSASSEGGSAATASGKGGSASAGDESDAGIATSSEGHGDQQSGSAGRVQAGESTDDQPDSSAYRGEATQSTLRGEDQRGGPADVINETPSSNRGHGDEGDDEAADVSDRFAEEPAADKLGERPLTGKREVEDRAGTPPDDPFAANDATGTADSKAQLKHQPFSEPKSSRSTAGDQGVSGRQQRAEGELMEPPGEQRTSRAVDVSQFDDLHQTGQAQPKVQKGAAFGLDASSTATASDLSGASAAIDRWLERIGSNPGPLLRSRFLLEERASLQDDAGPVSEPRPW